MMTVLVPLAEGCEEMEAVITVDTLRRAGWEVDTAGIAPGLVTCSRGVVLQPDLTWDTAVQQPHDMLFIPGGGPGTARLKSDIRVLDAIRTFDKQGKWLAAICAGPTVLHAAGVLQGHRATCYPGAEQGLDNVTWLTDRVVTDGHIVTSRGPGTTLEFALTLIRLVDGEAAAARVATPMLSA